MNVWNAIGYVGRDSEVRFTQGGTEVLSFSLAVEAGYGDRKSTVWVRVSKWGKGAEGLAPYVKKGVRIGVTGELFEDVYTDREGVERKQLSLRAASITLLGGRESGDRDEERPRVREAPQQQRPRMPPARRAPEPAKQADAWDDDIPF